MINLILKQIRVMDPARKLDAVMDLVIRDGILQPLRTKGAGLPSYDARGLIAAPGFWDTHVHFRDPGNPAAETRLTGAQAAAAGGFTHVVTMPNTTPPGDSVIWLREQLEDTLPVQIHPSACISAGRIGKSVADLESLSAAGAACFTDDGSRIDDDTVMREAMRRARQLRRPIFDHAVVASIAQAGVIRACETAVKFNLPVFPADAEIAAVARDIRLCRETGCTVVIQHISTAGAVDLVRTARAEGLSVFAEASPHHLALSAEEIPGDDGNWRMNPPLGTIEDRQAIREAVLDGTITLFATDHAPHPAETKNKGFLKASFGVVGLETAMGVTWKVMVEEEKMSIMEWIRRWTLGPAELLNCPAPTLAPGNKADLVVIDPNTPWTVDPDRFLSRSRNTPFAGQTLTARPVLTLCQGQATWNTLFNG